MKRVWRSSACQCCLVTSVIHELWLVTSTRVVVVITNIINVVKIVIVTIIKVKIINTVIIFIIVIIIEIINNPINFSF